MPDPATARQIVRGSVAGAVRAWLRGRELDGADLVRAGLALALAREVDDPASPRYARSKISSELRALLAELEGTPAPAGELDVKRLLGEVVTGWTRTN